MGNAARQERAGERRWDRRTRAWTTRDGPMHDPPDAVPGGSATLTVSRTDSDQARQATNGVRPAVPVTTAERLALLAEVVRWNDTDRRRMIGEMHSRLASPIIRALYAVRKVKASPRTDPTAHGELAMLEAVIEEAERELRALMAAELPLDDESGLAAMILDHADRFSRETGIAVQARLIGNPDALAGAIRRVILCAADEALLNIRKHAGASTVSLSLVAHGGRVLLRVEDDGRGMACGPVPGRGRGIGLGDIRDRVTAFGGLTRVGPRRQGGTTLRVWIDGGAS